MATPLNIYAHAFYNTNSNITLYLAPAHPVYFDIYMSSRPGVGIDPVSPDPVNEIFATVEDAVEYYLTNEYQVPSMIASLNGAHGTDYEVGEAVYNIPEVVFSLGLKVDKVSGKGLSDQNFSSSEKSKLSAIAASATANDTDANLKARANHTGTQALSTVDGLQSELDGKWAVPTPGVHISDGQINAVTNAPTNLNPVTTLLGSVTGEVNAANQRYNDLAAKYNELAGKYNTLLDRLEALSLLSAS